MIDGSHMSF